MSIVYKYICMQMIRCTYDIYNIVADVFYFVCMYIF